MRKKPKKIPTLFMLPLAAALFLIGWIMSFTGANKAERKTKQIQVQNNKLHIGVLLPEQQELRQAAKAGS
jgi:uncharacterized membrane protein YGL010W